MKALATPLLVLGVFVAPVVLLAVLVVAYLVLGPVGMFLALMLVVAGTLLAPYAPPGYVPESAKRPGFTVALGTATAATILLACWLLAAR